MPDTPRWRRYLRFWGPDLDADIDEELRFHVEQRVRDYERLGMSREQADAAAAERFGDITSIRRTLRRHDALRNRRQERHERMNHLMEDVRYALRGLRLHPGFAVTAVLTIALGVGANATVFGIIDQLLFRPPAYVKNPERIEMLSVRRRTESGVGQQTFNYPVYRTLREQLRSIDDIAIAWSAATDLPVGRGARALSARGILVSASYFGLLGVTPERGRFFTADEDSPPSGVPVVVISDGFWTRQFGRDPDVLGKRVEIGDQRYTIIGIAPRGFTGTELGRVDLWIPLATGMHLLMPIDWTTSVVASYAHVFLRLRPGIQPERAAAEADRVLQASFGNTWFMEDRHAALTPLVAARSVNVGTNGLVTVLLALMAVIVLLIACANLANLLLARALRRQQEIAIRVALGVSRARLVRLLITESLLVAALGGIGALLIVQWSGGIVRSVLFADVPWVGNPVDARVIMFAALAALVAGIAAGLLPAVQTSRPDVTGALKASARSGGGQRAHTRAGLLILQSALAVVLLVGAGLFVRSLQRVTDQHMGVDTDRVITGFLPLSSAGYTKPEVRAVYSTALERIRALTGIEHATVALTIPFGPSFGARVRLSNGDSLPAGDGPYVNAIGPDYFTTIGARLLGRDFTANDVAGAPRVTIVSEAMARRLWPARSAIGQCLLIDSDSLPCARVVGVAEDVRRQDILENPLYALYVPLAQASPQLTRWMRDLYVVARPVGDAARMIEPVRRAMQTAAPALPYALVQRISDMPELVTQLRQWQLAATLFAAFGVLALVLAAVGLFGVVSYSVAQRVHEIGLRIALGAAPGNVARLVVANAVGISAAGVALGLAVSLVGGSFVASALYGVSPHDPVVIGVVAALLLAVALLASAIPAYRAARVDPIQVLRVE
jgi:putative ABC transport system permease protein